MISRDKTAFVTGVTGFLGYELIQQLLADGFRVVALSRNGTLPGDLPRENLEIVRGDLDDEKALEEATQRTSVVYHVAANVQMWTKKWAESERANVVGTRNLVRAAKKAGVSRFVFTSSGSTIGKPYPPTPEVPTLNEDSEYNLARFNMVYPHTKWLAEQEVLHEANAEFSVVITHPTAVFGPGDWKANVLPLFLATRTFAGMAVPDGIRTTCDVRDVATAHIVAAAKAPNRGRYILGGEVVSVRDLFTRIARVMDGKAPRITLPNWTMLAVARGMEFGASLSGRPPKVSYEMAVQSIFRVRLSSERAAKELGYASRPLDQSIADMAAFYRDQGWI
jgi:dihydroflavonol-4-reductase